MLPNHHLKNAGAIALALCALAPAAASARPIPADPNQPTNTTSYTQPNPPSVMRVMTANNGFDWGDAGIGAAGGLALSFIGIGGALGVAQHRSRRTQRRSVPRV
jgi:hypothetical protein